MLVMASGYRINEIFRSLQGEGALVGTPMVFVRFAGCNLWNGREGDRPQAQCGFCDTDFSHVETLSGDEILQRIASLAGPAWLCLTGGEPALQLDRPLLELLRAQGWRCALETNGSLPIDAYRDLIDWICVSPKTSELRVQEGDELKLVYRGQTREELERLGALNFRHHLLQPEWGPRYRELMTQALVFLETQGRWRLSLQTHKVLGIR